MADAPQTPTSLDSSNEHTTTALYRAAIGPVNTEYYLKIFSKFETANRASAQWNSAAALNTINWMVFRKLWIPALAYTGCVLGVLLVVFGIGGLIFKFSDAVRAVLALLFVAASVAMPGFYGTALFHNACRKKMAHALISTPTLAEACTLLNRQASQRPRLLGIALANLALVGIIIGIIAALRRTDPDVAAEVPPVEIKDTTEARNVAVGRAIEDIPAVPEAPVSEPLAAASSPAVVTSAPEPIIIPAPVPAPVVSAPTTLPPVPTLPPLPAIKVPAKVIEEPKAQPTPKPTPKPESKPAPKPAAKVPATPVATTPTPKPQPKPSAPETTVAKESVYRINVGLFADENNARNAKTKLLDAGLEAYTEEAMYPKGKRTRVRVGPFATETEADTAAEKIRNLGLEAAVFKQ